VKKCPVEAERSGGTWVRGGENGSEQADTVKRTRSVAEDKAFVEGKSSRRYP
jgi:hypothetical protein